MKSKSFDHLGLASALLQNLEKMNYTKPYPIQLKAIPAIMKRHDVLGIAKTGSGKTASYALPILHTLQRSADNKNRHADVLVVVPTRELALQVEAVFKQFSIGLPIRVKTLAVYGGVSINPQMKALQNVNVLIATPGRLLELIDSNAVSIADIKTLVLDEADKMLNTGFKEEMDRIIGMLPKRRQTLLFSATLNEDVDAVKDDLLNQPRVIKVEDEVDDKTLELVNQSAYYIESNKKGILLRHLIKEKEMKQVLVFASSIKSVDAIERKLLNHDIDAGVIHSKCSQGYRERILQEFKSGKLQVLVATDLLGRGVDIEFLPYVVNYELPRSPKDFIHRIGRTGRAERSGSAITFVAPDEEHHFRVIQKKMKKWVDRVNMDDIDL